MTIDTTAYELRIKELQNELDAKEKALIRTQREFDAYRKRYSPVSKRDSIRWFRGAVEGTTEEKLLRAYMQVILEVLERYGEDE